MYIRMGDTINDETCLSVGSNQRPSDQGTVIETTYKYIMWTDMENKNDGAIDQVGFLFH